MPSLELLLGIVAAVILVGVVAVRVSVRLGLPSLLLYLGIGIVLGESVLGIQFSDAALTESLGLAALVLILAEGGLTTSWRAVRPALGLGIALSTVSVLVSIAVVGAALHILLDLEWRTALLWGAVLSVHRRGCRLQRAARRRGQQAALRCAGAGVRHERRTGRARRRAAVLR